MLQKAGCKYEQSRNRVLANQMKILTKRLKNQDNVWLFMLRVAFARQ